MYYLSWFVRGTGHGWASLEVPHAAEIREWLGLQTPNICTPMSGAWAGIGWNNWGLAGGHSAIPRRYPALLNNHSLCGGRASHLRAGILCSKKTQALFLQSSHSCPSAALLRCINQRWGQLPGEETAKGHELWGGMDIRTPPLETCYTLYIQYSSKYLLRKPQRERQGVREVNFIRAGGVWRIYYFLPLQTGLPWDNFVKMLALGLMLKVGFSHWRQIYL